jgi:hypothetical protein
MWKNTNQFIYKGIFHGFFQQELQQAFDALANTSQVESRQKWLHGNKLIRAQKELVNDAISGTVI